MSPAALMSRRTKLGAKAFSPASIAGLNVWYDATTLALADGASITAVADQSGNGRDVASVTGTPIYRSAGINGHPAIDFATGLETATNYFTMPSSVVAGCGPQGSMFIVWVRNSNNSNGCYVIASGMAQNHLPYVNGAAYLQAFTNNRRSCGAVPTPGTPQVLSLLSGSATFDVYTDGTSLYSDTAANSTPIFAYYWIGSSNDSTNYFQWNAKMGEFLIYNSSLGTTDRQAVESYLRTKWGTA